MSESCCLVVIGSINEGREGVEDEVHIRIVIIPLPSPEVADREKIDGVRGDDTEVGGTSLECPPEIGVLLLVGTHELSRG